MVKFGAFGKIIIVLALTLLLINTFAVALPANAQNSSPVRTPELWIYRVTLPDTAAKLVATGETQGHAYNVPFTVAQTYAATTKVYPSYTGINAILINPASETYDGTLNPFASRKVRYAVNFLINRDYIVTSVYNGYAEAIIAPYSSVDPDYGLIADVLNKWEGIIKFDPDYACQLINEGIQELVAPGGPWEGYELRSPDESTTGYWQYKKPGSDTWEDVTIIGIIRVEDERRTIGHHLADGLERCGIKVLRQESTFIVAYNTVYSTDPAGDRATGKGPLWHYYTAGWAFNTIYKYADSRAINWYSSIWCDQPGWCEPGFWEYKNPEADDLAKVLEAGNYTTMEEYVDLYKQLIDIGIQDSVYVWVATSEDLYLASPNLQGVANLPRGGPFRRWTFWQAYEPGKDLLKFTNRYVHVWAWNPAAGFLDIYSNIVYQALTLPGITINPITGDWGWSVHAKWEVEYDATVPADALVYDPEAHTWVQVGESSPAKVKIVYNYPLLGQIYFHDGSLETMADIVATLSYLMEWGTYGGEGDNYYDAYFAGSNAPFINYFRGIRVLNSTALELYTDMFHPDPKYLAVAFSVWTATPAELWRGMEIVDGDLGLYGISYYAWFQGKDWLDIIDPEHAAAVANNLYEEVVVNGTIKGVFKAVLDFQNVAGLNLITTDEIRQRAENLKNFFDEHNHVVIGNGPYYMDSFDPGADKVVLRTVEDLGYPYPLSWETWAPLAKEGPTTSPTLIKEPVYFTGDITFKASVTDAGVPTSNANVLFLLYDSEGNLVGIKDGVPVEEGVFEATFTITSPGTYRVAVMATSPDYWWPLRDEEQVVVLPGISPTVTTPTTTTPTTTTPTETTPTTTTPTVTTPTTTTRTRTPVIVTVFTRTEVVTVPQVTTVQVTQPAVTTPVPTPDLMTAGVLLIVGLIIGLIPGLLKRK
jgi:peptide/nickel transport system substrate-binding protein